MFAKTDNLKKYIKKLKKLGKNQLPEVIRKTMDATAFDVRKESIKQINNLFTTRNKFTEKSMRVRMSKKTRNIDQIQSEIGSSQHYMKTQEDGGTIQAKRNRIPIPTRRSRVGGNDRKPIAARFRMNRLGNMGGGNKFFKAKFNRVGIFYRKGKQLIMVRSLEHSSVHIKRSPWLKNSIDRQAQERQLNRRFVFFAKRLIKGGKR